MQFVRWIKQLTLINDPKRKIKRNIKSTHKPKSTKRNRKSSLLIRKNRELTKNFVWWSGGSEREREALLSSVFVISFISKHYWLSLDSVSGSLKQKQCLKPILYTAIIIYRVLFGEGFLFVLELIFSLFNKMFALKVMIRCSLSRSLLRFDKFHFLDLVVP